MTAKLPATIREVASRAGVSTATVSRVLSGVGKATPQTEARVRKAAEELGYRPSAVARSLRVRRTRTLGLIVTDIGNPFFPDLVKAADDRAQQLGFTILLGTAAYDERRAMHYVRVMADRRVDGVIVASSQLSQAGWSILLSSPVPVVVANAEPAGLPVRVITSDNLTGAQLAVQHLVQLGHRSIGYVRGPRTYTAARPRIKGFKLACEAAGLSGAATPIVAGRGDVESGARAARQLLRDCPSVTAIVCYNDLTAIGVLRALRDEGLRVPEDVSVVGCDDIAAASWIVPRLTTLAQQKAAMGRLAVEAVVAAIEQPGEQLEATVIRLPMELRIRESTGPARPG